MGICSSCLGNRRRDVYDEDDESRLLFDDPNGVHYGSFNEQQTNGGEDPQEAQREIDALQRVVARTSDNMVDIYEIAPHDKMPMHASVAAAPYAHAGQDAHMARYRSLLSKLSNDELASPAASIDCDVEPDDEDEEQAQNNTLPIKVEASGPLVGNFADAAAAMR